MITEADIPQANITAAEVAVAEQRAAAIERGWRVMTPHVEQEVNPIPMGELSDHYDIPDPVITEIDAGQTRFAVFRDKNTAHVYAAKMRLNTQTSDGKNYYTALAETVFDVTNEALTVGRASRELADDTTLSRSHFTIRLDQSGSIAITDLGGVNGTLLRCAPESQTTDESRRDQLRRKLFAPPLVDGESSQEGGVVAWDLDADYLFGEDPSSPPQESASKEVKAQPFRVTAETTDHAIEVLGAAKVSTGLNEVLEKHGLANAPDSEIVEQTRKNPDIRWDLAQMFLAKIDRIADYLPKRVKDNSSRSLSFRGYEQLQSELGNVTSREYVARMCLNMLDGTYDASREAETSDPIRHQYDERGNPYIEQGQHRYAAYRVLYDRE